MLGNYCVLVKSILLFLFYYSNDLKNKIKIKVRYFYYV